MEAYKTKTTKTSTAEASKSEKWNVLAIVAICTMWIPFVPIVLGIFALFQIKKTKEKGLWLAILSILLPIFAFIVLASGVIVLIQHNDSRTEEKAHALNISTNEYKRLTDSIDGNCRLEVIVTGRYYSEDSSFTKDFEISKVSNGYAIGKRTCRFSEKSEYFLARKDDKKSDNSTWRIIQVSSKRYTSCGPQKKSESKDSQDQETSKGDDSTEKKESL